MWSSARFGHCKLDTHWAGCWDGSKIDVDFEKEKNATLPGI
jgi:hypothetical protein